MKRRVTAIVLAVLVPVGISTKLYCGPIAGWVNRYAGDIVSPIFIFFLVLLFMPKLKPLPCAAGVFIFCAAVEFSQFLSTPLLLSIRGNILGRTILGSDFEWPDFIFYVIGIFISLKLYNILKDET